MALGCCGWISQLDTLLSCRHWWGFRHTVPIGFVRVHPHFSGSLSCFNQFLLCIRYCHFAFPASIGPWSHGLLKLHHYLTSAFLRLSDDVLWCPRNLASHRQTTVTRVPSLTKMHKIRQKKVPTGTSTFHCHSHSSPTRMRLSSTLSNHGSQTHTRLRHLFDQQLLQHFSFFKSLQILVFVILKQVIGNNVYLKSSSGSLLSYVQRL